MSKFEQVGKAFIEYYYGVFDQNRSQIGPLYQDNSLMTYEGTKIQGKVNIVKHLEGLSFKKVKHVIQTIDCQPSVSNGVMVFVSGELYADEDKTALKFSQVFHLMPTGQNNFYLTNDIFRLNYG